LSVGRPRAVGRGAQSRDGQRTVLMRAKASESIITYVRIIYLAVVALALGWGRLTWALNPEEGIAEYQHLIWRTGDQGLTAHAYSVTQTNDGYVWVGTTAGLLRFDGVRFQELEDAPNGLLSLYRSTDDSVWIGSTSKALMRLRHQKAETIDPGGPNVYVPVVTEDEAGIIWYAKNTQEAGIWHLELCSLDRSSGPKCVPGPSHLGQAIRSFAGAIWIGTDRGLIRFQDGKFADLPIAELASNTYQLGVQALLPDGQGGLLVGGHAIGLERLKDNILTPVRLGGLDVTRLSVTSLFKDREGALWIGTETDGLYRIYRDRIVHYAGASNSSSVIFQISEDQEGSIWFVTKNGLERFSDRRVVTVLDDYNFHSQEVDGISVSHDGALWIAGLDDAAWNSQI
jgi:ligand-binding sensor domain-containing protein